MKVVVEKIERNNLIYERYKQIIHKLSSIDLNAIYKVLLNSVYPCFYVSPERAEQLINYARTHNDNEQANDLLSVFQKVSNGRDIKECIYEVISHNSPQLYISPHTIKRIILKKRKELKQRRIVASSIT